MCPACAKGGTTRYCAPNRCYCGHTECPANHSYTQPKETLRWPMTSLMTSSRTPSQPTPTPTPSPISRPHNTKEN